MRLSNYFSNNFRWISSINWYSNVVNGSKNTKCCEGCLKTAKNLWFWSSIIYQLKQISSYQKYLILQNHFQTYNFYAFPKAILYEPQISCNFEYLYSSFVCSMSGKPVYCNYYMYICVYVYVLYVYVYLYLYILCICLYISIYIYINKYIYIIYMYI